MVPGWFGDEGTSPWRPWSAVSLCVSVKWYTDAIPLAAKGGLELLINTQKAYFEKHTVSWLHLRLFQSIVTKDLADIVQNAGLQEWVEIFVALCTFAKGDEFAGLAEWLGQRLEFTGTLRGDMEGDESGRMSPSHTSRLGSLRSGLRGCRKRLMHCSKSRTPSSILEISRYGSKVGCVNPPSFPLYHG